LFLPKKRRRKKKKKQEKKKKKKSVGNKTHSYMKNLMKRQLH
jgi:hypothetical protein